MQAGLSPEGYLSVCIAHFQPQVHAVSEWGAEGEWAVETVVKTLTQPPPSGSESFVINGSGPLHECVGGSLSHYSCLITNRRSL